MLVKYKNDYEKIAMGLLSFVPDLKPLDHLQTEMALYQNDPEYLLYLWRPADSQDFAGVVGIQRSQDIILVRHISLMPSERGSHQTFMIFDELAKLYPHQKLMGTFETTPLLVKWESKRTAADAGDDQQ
ncbi:N-acetyltransferase [Schleiferilactobacillus harbinensis]|jgi:riboflavin biosynthesis RibT protein|uniref:N-acetyltransferase n=2 Tax=Schleiferilactobacillus harbinensis TaxID=304207 RepID=A0A510TRH3_9LACO|nr:hypothetical protein [Schleiferilactobacillus harbinensis]HAY53093.1 N-acetyltransferase [Lactobacillus sp.]KRM28407.1 ribT protein [Schleiferilactobacillus harbinensis DSM 16991]MBO3090312.1 N-acetyltransferase [Schleiferilactobacillus harbinensis]MCI1688400.1 N-acetyltransferase [Schleiferilactobacillus harbinensis]MCI1782608.1 N-acetyltransferase [Schleiferilactobacillus harbinensis]